MSRQKSKWPDDMGEDPAAHPLPNPKQERFSQEVASGKPIHEAYLAAGYRGDPSNARRLRSDDAVWARIDTLQREIAGRVAEKTSQEIAGLGYSRADAMREAEEARKMALALGQGGPAVAAVKLRAQLAGHLETIPETGEAVDAVKAAKSAADPRVAKDLEAVKNAGKLIQFPSKKEGKA